jgi:hypothetical protein
LRKTDLNICSEASSNNVANNSRKSLLDTNERHLNESLLGETNDDSI